MVKRLTIALVGLALAGAAAGIWACGSSTSPSSSNLVVYNMSLLPSNEVPAIQGAENVARGTAVITIHKDTNTVDFAVSVNSFPAGSALTVAHIHGPNAPAGSASAPVFIGTGMTPGSAPAIVNGAATFTFNGVTPQSADQITQILANPSTFYFNVHTAQNPGGVMRGQLK
jgi:hypothetical protein